MGAFIKNFLLNLLNTRLYWLCVIMISVAFEYCGYYFQYVEELKPCELCVYERAAFAAIGLIGILVIFWPKGLKYIGIPLWIYASCMGLSIAIEHVGSLWISGSRLSSILPVHAVIFRGSLPDSPCRGG